MSFNNTKSLLEAKQKALAAGATHYFQHILKSGEIVSTYFVKGLDLVGGENLQEIAHYTHGMNSFNIYERLQPSHQLGQTFKDSRYTNLFSLSE